MCGRPCQPVLPDAPPPSNKNGKVCRDSGLGAGGRSCEATAAGIAGDVDGYLFRTAAGKAGMLTEKPLSQPDAYRMVQRRAKAAGIETRIGNHTFRATGITAYLRNSGKLEVAQHIANHESPRTTKLYDRRQDEISLDEIERIAI